MFYDSDLGQHLIKYLRSTRENRVGKHGYMTPIAFNPCLVPCCIVSGTTECHHVHRAASGSRMIIKHIAGYSLSLVTGVPLTNLLLLHDLFNSSYYLVIRESLIHKAESG